MGTIVLHAGAAKSGSSSIQAWLSRTVESLRSQGVHVMSLRLRDERPQLSEVGPGDVVNSTGPLSRLYRAANPSEAAPWLLKPWVCESLAEQLAAAATRQRVVVISAEALGPLFQRREPDWLAALESLAGSHRVRVAYYVRPQHTSLESMWRQFGYRSGMAPAPYLAHTSVPLHYFETHTSVNHQSPSLSFETRPFRRDLLDQGNVVVDFARRFLDTEPAGVDAAVWENPGLPLEMANLMRVAPPELQKAADDAKPLIAARHDTLPESVETGRSRRLLQAYCHAKFEPGNRRLIAALGWDTDAFIPPPNEVEETDLDHLLEALEALWEPKASRHEIESMLALFEHERATADEQRALLATTRRSLARADRALDVVAKHVRRSQDDLSRIHASLPAEDRLASITKRLRKAARVTARARTPGSA